RTKGWRRGEGTTEMKHQEERPSGESVLPVTPAELGFTLIELMVVVLIIGILVTIALPVFAGARNRASDKAAESILRNALPAAVSYYVEKATYDGFDVAAGQQAEPTIHWAPPGAPPVNDVAIQVAAGPDLLLI